MKLTRRLIIVFTFALVLGFPITAFLCGTERWNVKVCKDAAARVLFQNNSIASHQLKAAVPTTIDHLRSFTVPGPLALHTPRFVDSEAETNIWEIEGTLFEYKEENGATGDNDYHLVVRDNNGDTLVAEIPKQNCMGRTPQPLRDLVRQARVDFDARFSGAAHPTGTFKFTTTKVRITGQGFFDRPHASASAPNGIEIHPVIKIEFLPQ